MEFNKIFTDEDFGITPVEFNNPTKRNGARGIVVRDDGKIAIINKVKENVFKLPGGGIDAGETPEQAFKREVIEEVGCEIDVVNKLGTTEERKSNGNFIQLSQVFVGKVIKDLGHLALTEKEIAEGTVVRWLTPEQGLEKISGCVDIIKDSPCDKDESAYASKFIVTRDKYIVEQYIKSIQG